MKIPKALCFRALGISYFFRRTWCFQAKNACDVATSQAFGAAGGIRIATRVFLATFLVQLHVKQSET